MPHAPDPRDHTTMFGVELGDETSRNYVWTNAEDECSCGLRQRVFKLRHVTLGYNAIYGERNVVELEVLRLNGEEVIKNTIAVLSVGRQEMSHILLDFTKVDSVSLTLSKGSGPVSILGHVLHRFGPGNYYHANTFPQIISSSQDEGSSEDEDEDEVEGADESEEDEEEEAASAAGGEREKWEDESTEKGEKSKQRNLAKNVDTGDNLQKKLTLDRKESAKKKENISKGGGKLYKEESKYRFKDGYAVRSIKHSIDVDKAKQWSKALACRSNNAAPVSKEGQHE